MAVLAVEMEAEMSPLAAFMEGYSIEVMPKTAEKIEDFSAILPAGTRVYVAHIDGTPIEDMWKTAERIAGEGFEVMPHFPARSIEDLQEFEKWVAGYAERGVSSALVLAGGIAKPRGALSDSMQLLKAEIFEKYGFKRLHVAGHPEGAADIDKKGSTQNVDAALQWKNDYAKDTDAKMALATQFAFEAAPVIAWADRIKANGISLPIHIGVAGPAKLQTLIKFAMISGVGPSLNVLKKRGRDLTKLVLPFSPDEFLGDLAAHKAANPDFNITNVHLFPFGGIAKTAAHADELLKG